MRNIIIDYSEKDIKLYDRKGTHILLNNFEKEYLFNKLKLLVSSIQFAEISIMVNKPEDITLEFINFCMTHRIILYWNLVIGAEILHLQKLSNLDLVAFIREENIEEISEKTLREIIESNLNLIIILKDGNFQKISSIYERLLGAGFVKLFFMSYIIELDDKKEEHLKLISRQDIQQNNIQQNINIRNQIEHLKHNIMKRHNRALVDVNKGKINVCFVNVNVNVYMKLERKNLGIEYLASVLNLRGYYADCLYTNRLTMKEEIEKIIGENNIRVLGFSCMQDNMYAVRNIIKDLKKKYPDIIFIVGGAQAIVLGNKFISDSGVDYIMSGESENSIVQLMDYIFYHRGNLEDINNLGYVNSKGIFAKNPQGELIDNLDNIPFPNYVLKNDDHLIHAGILTGRGCPFKCAFCYEGSKEKTVRYRSLDNVFEEITLLLKNHKNLKCIQLYDDTFTLDEKRVKEFCRRIKKIHDDFGITWMCEMHCQTIYDKPELIKLMVESGLKEAQIGIESGNDEILCKLNKKITSEMILKTVENCRKAGVFRLEGNILLGAAGENRVQLENNLTFVEQLLNVGKGMIQVYPVLLWPFPNTPINSFPGKYGIKILEEQMEYTVNCMGNCVSETNDIDRQELVEHYFLLYEKIMQTYSKYAVTFTRQEAKRYWLGNGFNLYESWGRALASIDYINNFFVAKEKKDITIWDDDVYPIRSFELLSYKDTRIYLRETDILLESFDSRILEMCNGKNTVKNIAKNLKTNISIICEHLEFLENRMLVYGTIY